jgi:Mycobacterium membrane protein
MRCHLRKTPPRPQEDHVNRNPRAEQGWRAWRNGVASLAIIAAAVVAFKSCEASNSTSGARVDDASAGYTYLVFEITGSAAEASMTWTGDRSGVSQENNAPVPWTKAVKYTTGIAGVSVSAQNTGGGTITCTIKKDGEIISTNTSTGDYAIVSCAVA